MSRPSRAPSVTPKKGAYDTQRGRMSNKAGRELSAASRTGGGDFDTAHSLPKSAPDLRGAETPIAGTIGCLFCHNKGGSDPVVLTEKGFLARKCRRCELVYLSPRPTWDEIKSLYEHDRAHVSAKSDIAGRLAKRLHAKHSLGILKRYKRRGLLLELGCGAGYFINEARRAGFDVYGIEPNPVKAEYVSCRLNIPCQTDPLSELPADKMFDVIYHGNVLSHFYDPIHEFKEMNNHLNSDGILMFETGNFGEIDETYYPMFKTLGFPDHLFFFGTKSVGHLLSLTGFYLVKVYMYPYSLRLIMTRFSSRLFRIYGFLRRRRSAELAEISRTTDSRLIRIFETLIRTIWFLYTYKIGVIFPQKRKAPHTVIVVAKKATGRAIGENGP